MLVNYLVWASLPSAIDLFAKNRVSELWVDTTSTSQTCWVFVHSVGHYSSCRLCTCSLASSGSQEVPWPGRWTPPFFLISRQAQGLSIACSSKSPRDGDVAARGTALCHHHPRASDWVVQFLWTRGDFCAPWATSFPALCYFLISFPTRHQSLPCTSFAGMSLTAQIQMSLTFQQEVR